MRLSTKWRNVLILAAGALLVREGVRRLRRRRALVGKVVAITGGSRGLGFALAREAVRRGARVSLCARGAEELERAEVHFALRGSEVFTTVADVRDPFQIVDFIARTTAHYGGIDILINNAGVIEVGLQEAMRIEDYREAMDTHFWGPWYAVQTVLPQMRRMGGTIVNIASFGGKVAAPHMLPYAASKFALVGFSEGLHAELHREGIHVLTVCPGLMRTGSPRNAFFKGQNRKEYAWFAIADSMPYLSIGADSAARKILNAAADRVPELILTGRAVLAAKAQGLFPNITAHVLALLARAMPAPGGIGSRRLPGSESDSPLSRSALTALTQRAAVRNNEL